MKPQQLQGVGLSSSGSSFSQLGCVPPLLAQQTPQVYVSQSAAGQLNTSLVWFLISELMLSSLQNIIQHSGSQLCVSEVTR